jgi:hypothetical protein
MSLYKLNLVGVAWDDAPTTDQRPVDILRPDHEANPRTVIRPASSGTKHSRPGALRTCAANVHLVSCPHFSSSVRGVCSYGASMPVTQTDM